jgi:iron complex transport system permease protein
LKRLTPARLAGTLTALALLLAASLAVGLAVGPSGLAPLEVWAALSGDATGAGRDIVLGVRLPRVGLGAGVGAALAVAGVVFQALLRNPLADPFVLGVSGGAALAGIAVLVLGSAVGLGYGAVPPAAFAGSVGALVLLLAVAGPAGRLSSTTLLLVGVVFNAFASAAIVFLASLAGLTEGAQVFLWLIGNLADARPILVGWVAGFVTLGLAATLPFARALDLLALGEENAALLGIDATRARRWLLLASSLLVGAAVSVAGLIGFVGLVVPHALRLALGPDHRLLVPASALAGAAFLVLCDTAARTVLGGRELPVGALTALAGGPFFLFLLRRSQPFGGRT